MKSLTSLAPVLSFSTQAEARKPHPLPGAVQRPGSGGVGVGWGDDLGGNPG